MTPKQFNAWLTEMKSGKRPLAKSNTECARLIGISRRTVQRYKLLGAPDVVAIACNAALHKIGKYGK